MTYSKNQATHTFASAMIAIMLLMGTNSFVRPFNPDVTTNTVPTGLPAVTTAALPKKSTFTASILDASKARPKMYEYSVADQQAASAIAAATTTSTGSTAAVSAKGSSTASNKTGVALSPTPAPAPAPAPSTGGYPLHTGIRTTMFWTGEDATAENGFIQNFSSAWQEHWSAFFGGVDDPNSRCGWNPCAFTPHENPFYFALPFSDYGNSGPKSNLGMVYWNHGALADGQSILKNRWIEVSANGKTLYAQWEDVGPYNEDDSNYVFGSAAPKFNVGLDLSPAANDYLGIGGWGITSWRFVEASQVPAGPWKTTITTSGPNWD